MNYDTTTQVEIKIDGDLPTFNFGNFKLSNSLMYSLFMVSPFDNPLDNLRAEIARIDNDIERVDGILVLNQNRDEVITTIRKSDNMEQAAEKIMEQFNVTRQQANAYQDLSLGIVNSFDFGRLKSNLVQTRDFFMSMCDNNSNALPPE